MSRTSIVEESEDEPLATSTEMIYFLPGTGCFQIQKFLNGLSPSLSIEIGSKTFCLALSIISAEKTVFSIITKSLRISCLYFTSPDDWCWNFSQSLSFQFLAIGSKNFSASLFTSG